VTLRDLHLTRAPRHLALDGLLWWVRGRLGGIHIDGLAVRVTRCGRLVLVWPVRRDSRGHQHPLIWPIDRRVREAIRHQVLAEVSRRLGRAP
jgi:hypothetical protein